MFSVYFPLPSEGEGQGEGDYFTRTFILPPQGGGDVKSSYHFLVFSLQFIV